MRYYQYESKGKIQVAVEKDPGQLISLTSIEPRIKSTYKLFEVAEIFKTNIDVVARDILKTGKGCKFPLTALLNPDRNENRLFRILPPIDAPEVWAFGVTYMDSMRERQAESDTPDVYSKIYNAERPEAFFKATGNRSQPPFADVGIRQDSTWDVPEPELAFVVFGGKIAGFTIGNDMSSRSIEGENPLYLPQAKVYKKSLSFGPCIATPEMIKEPQNLNIDLEIDRSGVKVFNGQTNTRNMKRDCEYLLDWLTRHNEVYDGTVVLTGTGTIPPPEFTLKDNDIVRISIENIGTLVNTVVTV
tara:strand:- start:42 stop:947 length:906 start_codon:yes stop_codon:yes gene_type:complete